MLLIVEYLLPKLSRSHLGNVGCTVFLTARYDGLYITRYPLNPCCLLQLRYEHYEYALFSVVASCDFSVVPRQYCPRDNILIYMISGRSLMNNDWKVKLKEPLLYYLF